MRITVIPARVSSALPRVATQEETRSCCAGGLLWTLLDSIFTLQALACFMFGIRTQPSIRNPIASTSLRDFWAHRWNLPTSSVLRSTCYDPILRLLVANPKQHQTAAAPTVNTVPSTPQLSTKRGVVQTASSISTNSNAASQQEQVLPATPSRYNLRPRTGANSVNSKAASTSVDTPQAGKPVTATAASVNTPPNTNSHSLEAESTAATRISQTEESRKGKSVTTSPQRIVLAKSLGSFLAFFVSGVAHHCLIHLFSGMPLHDVRFALLFWIQPPCIALQEACHQTKWWRSVRCQAPLLARCV
jgi:hypothetical protein